MLPWNADTSLFSSSGFFLSRSEFLCLHSSWVRPLASHCTDSSSLEDTDRATAPPHSSFLWPCSWYICLKFPNCLRLSKIGLELSKNSAACFSSPLDLPAFILSLTTEPPSSLYTPTNIFGLTDCIPPLLASGFYIEITGLSKLSSQFSGLWSLSKVK